jgi:PhnB protein
MLVYDDAVAAIDFLCSSFGFSEEFRLLMPDGRIGHAEVRYGGSVLMLAASFPEFGLLSPASMTEHHSQLHCMVDDVDAHFETARREGATIVSEPRLQPHGARVYRAIDLEGHRWMFSGPEEAE